MFDISQNETKQLPPVDSTEFPPKPVFSVIPDTCLFTAQSAIKGGGKNLVVRSRISDSRKLLLLLNYTDVSGVFICIYTD